MSCPPCPARRRSKAEPQKGRNVLAKLLIDTEPSIRKLDFRKFLSSLDKGTVDLALTDPPYAISRKTGFSKVKNGVKRFAVSMEFGEWDQKEIDLEALCNGLYRVLRKGGTAIVWYDLWKITLLRNAMHNAGFKMIRQVIWQKTNPVPLNIRNIYLSNSREMAVVGIKGGKPTFHSEYDNGVYHYPIPRSGGGGGCTPLRNRWGCSRRSSASTVTRAI